MAVLMIIAVQMNKFAMIASRVWASCNSIYIVVCSGEVLYVMDDTLLDDV